MQPFTVDERGSFLEVLIAPPLEQTGVGQIRERNFDGKLLMIKLLGAAKSKGVNYKRG